MNLDNIKYDKFDYLKYRKRINECLKNPKLNELGIKYNLLGFTDYNYAIETITVGYGDSEIFVVGGTHGSEIIGVDYVTQLIQNMPNCNEFDPSVYKIIFIPLQNPEGFDITTSTTKNINEEELEKKSYEYYERYRTDSIISKCFEDLNKLISDFITSDEVLTSNKMLDNLKKFVKNNKNWKSLSENRAIPKLQVFNSAIQNIKETNSFEDLKNKILIICNEILNNKSDISFKDDYLYLLIKEIKNGFNESIMWQEIDQNNKKKLHQIMFEESKPNDLYHKELSSQLESLYKNDIYPKGSEVTFDANGNGINLNANTPLNPGIELINNNIKLYANGPRNNVIKYFKGPIGAPTKDNRNFEYEKENKVLYSLINESFKKGKYLSTFLYHGTGGMVYYKPYENIMENNIYQNYYLYNKTLASIYSLNTNYKMLESSDKSGYGDYLRSKFPGVLLVELSKMGGNPIGPYGDKNNIYNTMNDNFKAFNNILAYYNKEKIKENIKPTK